MSKYERACAGVRGGHYCFSCGVVCMSGPIPCQRIILKSLDCVCLARPWYRTHWMTATAPTVPLQTLMLLFPSKRVQWEPCEAASRPPAPQTPTVECSEMNDRSGWKVAACPRYTSISGETGTEKETPPRWSKTHALTPYGSAYSLSTRFLFTCWHSVNGLEFH